MYSYKERTATLGFYDNVEVEQLGYCNAFIRHCYTHDINADPLLIRDELVSYCTPIIDVVYNMQSRITNYNCSQAATCSATTRKHVGRFLKAVGADICYIDVKEALKSVKGRAVSIRDNSSRIASGADYLDRRDIVPYEDAGGLFKVRYESIKPFNPYC